MDVFYKYLIIVNVIGFVLYFINLLLYKFTASKQVDILLTMTATIGGSLGILLYIILFDRKSEKDNMMSRVYVVCVFVIQLVLFLFLKGKHWENITIAFWDFFAKYKILVYYLVIINFITFAAFAFDKIAALRRRSRVKILTLLGLCFIGGSLGGLGAMYLYRHKTKQDYFTVGVPLIILTQVIVVFYLMNL